MRQQYIVNMGKYDRDVLEYLRSQPKGEGSKLVRRLVRQHMKEQGLTVNLTFDEEFTKSTPVKTKVSQHELTDNKLEDIVQAIEETEENSIPNEPTLTKKTTSKKTTQSKSTQTQNSETQKLLSGLDL